MALVVAAVVLLPRIPPADRSHLYALRGLRQRE